jgi:hypothetical protein
VIAPAMWISSRSSVPRSGASNSSVWGVSTLRLRQARRVGALMLRFRPSVGGEIIGGEAGTAEKAGPDRDSGQRGPTGVEPSRARCPVLRSRTARLLRHIHIMDLLMFMGGHDRPGRDG